MMTNQSVFVVGGDGFCGWPTALYLSSKGYEVTIVDNLSRRKIDADLGIESLTPIASMAERLDAWKEHSGKDISFHNVDVAKDYLQFKRLLEDKKPHSIVHFGEQRAAPYSMKNEHTKNYTIENNIGATHNIINAVTTLKIDSHIVHLGTMGVYGYGTAGMKIPEGYLNVNIDLPDGGSAEQEILYPVNPGSVYHMSKTLDQLLFAYYNKNDGLRVTDLHQGIVWGTQTAETSADERLVNRFDYDGDYGTVLNRFLMQAAIGYPLTIHGTGGQTRAFIHITDTVRCVEIAINNPPKSGDKVAIYNQMTETHRIRELAEKVSGITGAEVQLVDNPRKEDAENDLHVANDKFVAAGLEPTTLDDGLLKEVEEIANKYKHRCNLKMIPCTSTWVK